MVLRREGGQKHKEKRVIEFEIASVGIGLFFLTPSLSRCALSYP